MYYEIFKSRISAGNYQLADIQKRIKKLYALGDLTEEQLDELLLLSQKNASVDAERPESLRLITSLSARVETLEKLVLPKEDAEGEVPKYAPWTPWDGISKNYQQGAVVTHNGKLWKSLLAGQNVWEPGAVGTEHLWIVYVEEVAENV